MGKNVYYSEGVLGLEKVAEMELRDADWEFDIAAVWFRSKDERFYAGRDSGCSCPTPFEDFTSLGDLEGPFTRQEIQAWVRKLNPEQASRRVEMLDAVIAYARP